MRTLAVFLTCVMLFTSSGFEAMASESADVEWFGVDEKEQTSRTSAYSRHKSQRRSSFLKNRVILEAVQNLQVPAADEAEEPEESIEENTEGSSEEDTEENTEENTEGSIEENIEDNIEENNTQSVEESAEEETSKEETAEAGELPAKGLVSVTMDFKTP